MIKYETINPIEKHYLCEYCKIRTTTHLIKLDNKVICKDCLIKKGVFSVGFANKVSKKDKELSENPQKSKISGKSTKGELDKK